MIPTLIPDWLLPTFLLLPALAWMFLGVGLPWALAILPRADWRDRVTVIAVALALGPALTTAAMFLIGTFGQFSVSNVLITSALVALVGVILARRNCSALSRESITQPALTAVDFTLFAVVALALILRFWNTAYWPYTTYDEFWVYGYNAKIFMLRGNIPSAMGYYPQLIPLAFTYGQLMWGAVDAHAARTIVSIFALASVLMSYVLGARLFNRRVGLLTAALWALYPQHTAWSQFGDLEVPTTLYFTATVVFFILGWRMKNRRYVILSGLVMGAGLWTKPTSAALVESIVLIGLVALWTWIKERQISLSPAELLHRFRTSQDQRVQYSLIALIAAAPLGGMWYIRNILFHHPPLVFPAGYWQLQAQRSGQELGWPLLIAAALTMLLILRKERVWAALGALALLAIGSLPSAFGYRLPTYDELSQLTIGALPGTLKPTHLTILEYAILAVGAGLLTWAAIPLWRRLAEPIRVTILLLIAFIVPYFVTWFWSYSYHPRLSFAIVPLMLVLLAALLDTLRTATAVESVPRRRLRSIALSAVIVALALPGLIAGLSALPFAVTGALPNDHDKIAQGNLALMGLVDYLTVRRDPNRYPAALKRPMYIQAPGELRLPFFFPNDDIRTEDYPLALDQIVGVDYFVDSSVGQRLYLERGQPYNQILSSLTRDVIMTREYTIDDKNFRFAAYSFDNNERFKQPPALGIIKAQIGDFAILYGWDISRLDNVPGEAVLMTLWWQARGPADLDYSVFIHLWDPRQNKVVGQWDGEPVSHAWGVWKGVLPENRVSIPYHTRLWQAGEIINDEWRLVIPQAPPGVYELRVGLYDPLSGRRLPVMQDGKDIGEWVRLKDFTIH